MNHVQRRGKVVDQEQRLRAGEALVLALGLEDSSGPLYRSYAEALAALASMKRV